MINQCGPFKSAYAQNILNHLVAINLTHNQGKFDTSFLDIYSKDGAEDEIVGHLYNESQNMMKMYPE